LGFRNVPPVVRPDRHSKTPPKKSRRQSSQFVRQLLKSSTQNDSNDQVASVTTSATLPVAFHLATFAARPLNYELIVPLALACFSIMIILPIAAARSRLHIPGWVGFAFFSFILSYTCARLSAVSSYVGRPTGVFFSILCFLFLAAALGSVIALFFYRDPPGL
jgi:hypothetical protein